MIYVCEKTTPVLTDNCDINMNITRHINGCFKP